ncbi:carboxylesterase/lipase family protein [Nocardioides panzhihuensis]|uniref:Carboxylic ester hydrolase n=1 Tax=Nocardioides panzhihuensis TaxID=860243 RepID=A0A7Z0DNL0_9ACTN|nr:carboxylesterase family protein [Nocardioides panzhihuensis]NYI78526.1 para-nitrobenzyl esterase [Nocardioides panzhihuensis]
MSIRILSLFAAIALAGATLLAPPSVASAPHDPGVVRVDTGWVRGQVAEDHVAFTSIPYAAPPVDERRWRAPSPPDRWSGVRKATSPSPLCPQPGDGEVIGTEDCLYLDVTVPRGSRPGTRLPVVVWLYGGGFTNGGTRAYGAARLATEGQVIVVAPNYRLGALGFLSSPALDSTGGNYGLSDQQAALRWVQRNASRFGGDPHNVTLAGQSAGARAVCAQLASPRARQLFDRAILQSGACDTELPGRTQAERWAAQATSDLGCASAADVAGCLRGLPAAELVGALRGVGFEKVTARVKDRPWGPVAGTSVLPRQPGDAVLEGTAASVPLLIGGTRDEMRSFVAGYTPDLTEDGYEAALTDAFGDRADEVLAEYPVSGYASPPLALATVLGDWGGSIGTCPALRTADGASAHQPVYAYEFTEATDTPYNGVPLGSFHGLDLPYLWDLSLDQNPYPDLTREQEQLSATMIDYWAAFARTGDPNGPGRPHWPEYAPGSTVVELSTTGIAPTPSAGDHHCDFWAGLPR